MTPDATAAEKVQAIVDRFRGRRPLTIHDLEYAVVMAYHQGFSDGRSAPPAIVRIGAPPPPEITT